MKRYQLGYRFPIAHMADFTTPYVDLPEFDSTQADAYKIHARLCSDFPLSHGVEWRLVEVIR